MKTDHAPRIAFDDVGSGLALLHLAGWCSNRTVFRPMLPLAARRYRALALDWRGHGESDPVAGDFGEDALVADALAVIAAAELDRVVPVALAHAGWVAIELRRRLGPERVPGIVLLDWMPLGAPAPFFGALEGLQTPERWRSVRDGLLSMWVEGLAIPALDAHIAEMAAYGREMWSRAAREIEASFARCGPPVDALDALQPRCPTLHVYAQPADDDFLVAQEQYAAAHEWFRVRRLDARSHFPMFEVAEQLQSVIDDFVEETASTGAVPTSG